MIGTCCILGRAPRTKETLPDFCEWCRVTRHPPDTTSIPRVDGLSTRHPGFRVSHFKQTMVVTSSNHSEIIAIHEASRECIWLRSMIQHI